MPPLLCEAVARGVYSLRELGADFRLEVPDAPAGAFRAIEGLALVSYARCDRIEGSIFLRLAMRLQSPIAVPQMNLPMRSTFKVSKE